MRQRMYAIPILLMFLSPSAAGATPADWLLRGAAIHGGEPGASPATALAVQGERIVWVGDEEGAAAWIGPETRVVDGAGLHVYPGLVDAHAHLASLGASLEQVDLHGAPSLAAVLERVRARHAELPDGAWLLGRGWDQNDWSGAAFPRAAELDAVVGDRPVRLRRVDGHAVWVSSSVLARAGVTRETPDPPGGRILRDERGDPTGVLIDNAIDLVSAVEPEDSAEDLRRRLLRAQRACHEAGLTGMHDMGVNAEELGALRALEGSGELTLRVHAALADDPALWQRELARGPASERPGGRLAVRSVKLYADGALGSRGAALLEDYADDAGNRGLLLSEPESLLARARRATEAGFQICVHAIGDRGNRVVLDVFEHLLADAGPEAARRLRPRIEHVQVLHPEDVPRLGRLGVIASVQPTHCTSDMPWAPERLGPKRVRGAYLWKRLLEQETRLAFGSDFPVESHDPRFGLWAAVTRRTPEGEPAGGWSPEERVDLAAALDGFSRGAAWAAFREDDLGRIAPGRLADLTIFDRPLDGGRPQSILEAQVEATVVGGRVVHAAEGGRWAGLLPSPTSETGGR